MNNEMAANELRLALSRIEDPAHWIKDHLYESASGQFGNDEEDLARDIGVVCKYCADGALMATLISLYGESRSCSGAWYYLLLATDGDLTPAEFSDLPEVTHGDIVALYRRAIKRAEECNITPTKAQAVTAREG